MFFFPICKINLSTHKPQFYHITESYQSLDLFEVQVQMSILRFCFFKFSSQIHIFQSGKLWTKETIWIPLPSKNMMVEEILTITYLGGKWSQVYWKISSKLKDRSLYCVSLTTRKETQFLADLCKLWRKYIKNLEKNLLTCIMVLQKLWVQLRV